MTLRKVMSTALVLSLVGTAAIGCGKKDETQTPGTGTGGSTAAQELKINFAAEPPALDVSKASAAASFNILNAVHEGLYRLDKDGKPTPGLAKDMPKVSADGLTYTITLRDANWSDGTPVTANDFVYSFQRTLDPTTKAEYAFVIAWIKGGDAIMKAKTPEEIEAKKKELGAVAKDDKTLEITLEKPVAFFTEILAFLNYFPQKESFVKPLGEKNGADADKVIGAGPYKLTKWNHEQSLELVKNDKYWDAANVKLEKITVNIVKDTNSGLNLYETGQADLSELKGDQYQAYQGKPDLTIKKELTNVYLEFQEKKVPAFANAKVRAALSMAIDRKGFVDTVISNGSVPSTGLVPGGTSDGNGNEFRTVTAKNNVQAPFDAAKAKQLLQDGLKELNMAALPQIKLLGDDTETSKKSLEFIIEQWRKNLGVDAITEPIPHKLRLDRSEKHEFDVVLSLWGADYNDPMTFLDMFLSDNPFNRGQWVNKQYDELIKKADKEIKPADRAKLLADAEKILLDEAGVAPIYFRSRPYALRPNVQNLILPPFGPEWELRWTSIK
ncbi:peptide ABC transporter substrate-binding protein [Paenibacillus sp. MBLB4367]|uniref:peptide ABC transporter substrate-binding protein n=1 Tax=Paenibacillus sp. MBLB4367 TaxID=3384767 RepID=UPI0039081FBB